MAGIYIHIPFCRKACSYCDFHFSVNHDKLDLFLDALLKEIVQRRKYIEPALPIDTIYFGGGTPSLLNIDQLELILQELNDQYIVNSDAEITLEANPDDLDGETLKALSHSPVNRLSIGVQSFHDRDLELMGRTHTGSEAKSAVENAHAEGFDNITLDLIYGLPGSTMEEWSENVSKALSLPVQHLSCYGLTVEPRTLLQKQVEQKQVELPTDDQVNDQFDILHSLAIKKGFDHYEISNLALPGYRSRHNSNYWKGIPYVGLGPAAHSFDGRSRRWNIRSNSGYIQSVGQGKKYWEEEILTPEQKFNEYIMTGLRTSSGIDTETAQKYLSEDRFELFLVELKRIESAGLGIIEGGKFKLNSEGWKVSDRIISDLFA